MLLVPIDVMMMKLQVLSLKLMYLVFGLFALMVGWPFIVSFSRLVLANHFNGDALIWLALGGMAVSSSMLFFNTMRDVATLSSKRQILRSSLATGLALPATIMLLMFASNPA